MAQRSQFNGFFLFLTALLFTGCATMPKNAKEFREFSNQHQGTHVVTTESPLADVIARVKSHVQKCSTFGSSFTRSEGYMVTNASSETFAKWENIASGGATLKILIDRPNTINQPKGGQIFFLMDIKSSGSKTVATLYDLNAPSWANYNYVDEFTKVVKGQKAPCQIEEIQK